MYFKKFLHIALKMHKRDLVHHSSFTQDTKKKPDRNNQMHDSSLT